MSRSASTAPSTCRQLVYGVASAIWLLPAMFGDQRRPPAPPPRLSPAGVPRCHLARLLPVAPGPDRAGQGLDRPGLQARVAAANPPPDNPLAGLATFTGNFWVVATGAWVLSLLVAAVLFRWVERPALLHKPTRRPGAGGPGSAARERRPEAATA
ncbi:MAG: hypothetical protein R2690_15710 [Acidimicrobiales bacterium]